MTTPTAERSRELAVQLLEDDVEHVVRFETPSRLARALDPNTITTPALKLLDEVLLEVEKAANAALRRAELLAQLVGTSKYEDVPESEIAAAVDETWKQIPSIGCERATISMPPQEGKSERISHVGSLWMLTRNPNLRIGGVSYDLDTARRMSYAVRNDIVTFDGREAPLDLGLRLRKDTKAANRWYLAWPHKGGMYAIGIGGALTGRPIDCLIIDDPVKDVKAAESVKLSEDAAKWWSSVARPRLAPGAPVLIVMTRWHEADLVGRLLTEQRENEKQGFEHFDRWRVINIPAQADHDPERDETDLLGRKPGEFMLSVRGRTLEQWQATKINTRPRDWYALFQGRPAPEAGDVFERDWWCRYSAPLWTEDVVEGEHGELQTICTVLTQPGDKLMQSWDMAFKDLKTSDYVCGGVWLKRGANVFLLDLVWARLSFPKTLDAVLRLSQKWPQAKTKLVEEKANGAAVIAMLKKRLGGFIPENPKESKEARAAAVSDFVEARNVWLPDSEIASFDVDDFIEECAAFPNSAHDDRVDMTTQALKRLLLKPGDGAVFIEAWRKIAERDGIALPDRLTRTAADDSTAMLHESADDTQLDPAADDSREGRRARRLSKCRQPYYFNGHCIHCSKTKDEHEEVAHAHT